VASLLWSSLAETAVSSSIDSFGLNSFGLIRSVIIAGSCLFVLLVASRTIQYPNVGMKMSLGFFAPIVNNISVAGFLASMSLGHILGTLLIINFVEQ
jgi:photosystem I reaction center subunit PsaK